MHVWTSTPYVCEGTVRILVEQYLAPHQFVPSMRMEVVCVRDIHEEMLRTLSVWRVDIVLK